MAGERATKDEFFRVLETLDSEDESTIDEGRLASEAFLKKSIQEHNATKNDSSAVRRGQGSSGNTDPLLSDHIESSINITQHHPAPAPNAQQKMSAPLDVTSLRSSREYGTNKERQELPPTDRAWYHSKPSVPLIRTTSAPIQISTSSVMVSSAALKAGGKRKRGGTTPQVPEHQRLFNHLHFCKASMPHA
jgi:hypothetical protein